MSSIHGFIQWLLRLPKFPGRDFLIVYLPKWFLRKPKDELLLSTRFGFTIWVHPVEDQSIELAIFERGVYELGSVALYQRFIQPGFHVVDAGANIGFMTLLAAQLAGKDGQVTAFEPVPSTYSILQRNVAINPHLSNIALHPFALGNENGSMFIYHETGNRGGASLLNQHDASSEMVEVRRLDDLLLSTKVDFLKVDVEGFEWEVLKGGVELIRRDQPYILVEYSKDRINSGGEMGMYHWIQSLQLYDVFRMKRGKERPSSLIRIDHERDLPEHDNVLCIPRNTIT